MTSRDTTRQAPGSCTWCGHQPHRRHCSQRIRTTDSQTQLTNCPCAKPTPEAQT